MARSNLNLMIAGEAGQGLVTVGQLLAKSLTRAGYHIVVTQGYHSRIRGGHNTYVIRVSDSPIAAGAEEVDILLALNQDGVQMHRGELSAQGIIVADQPLASGEGPFLAVPMKDLAEKRYLNTVALGVAACLIHLDQDIVARAVEEAFKKHPEAVEPNRAALAKAYEFTLDKGISVEGLPPARPAGRLMINGNEAIAMGALSAGVKFGSFYPMTPATSIMLNLVANAKKMGLVVEQAEDEISAINMAIGASYAGAPAMVSTSGGGYALMTEGLSLAAMTETPLVVAIAMRPGPATGLPTRTEQGDLNFALYGGHGEFPRAVFTPGSPEECFHLARKAFATAENFQAPVFILTDQYLADSYRAVDPFPVEDLDPVAPVLARPTGGSGYRRYELSPNGISPRLAPGMGPDLVVADSDEHDQEGHITEDLGIRVQMMDKRFAKVRGMVDDSEPPTYKGPDNPEVLLVCWGSSKGPVEEAAQLLGQQGTKAASLHFSQVWPLAPEHFMDRLVGASQVVCVEGNLTGQFSRLLRLECGMDCTRRILRYDGLPFTPQYIVRELLQ